MTKEPLELIFSWFSGGIKCDRCGRDIEKVTGRGLLLLPWRYSEYSKQCVKDFTGLKKLPEVIAFCAYCGKSFESRLVDSGFNVEVLWISDEATAALRFIKAKDPIVEKFYKMIEEGKSHDEALETFFALFDPATKKRDIQKKETKTQVPKKERSIGVTIFAVLAIVYGALGVMVFFLPPLKTETTIEYWVPSLPQIVFLFCGIGLLKVKEWCRFLILISAAYGSIRCIYILFHYVSVGNFFSIAWYLSFIIFLTRPKIRKQFK